MERIRFIDMKLLITVIVTFFAGMGAGLGTGFAGMSAAVITPMLITFLGIDPYMAVGIALSSDVLASAVSAYTYGKNKNLDIKNGLIMMASVLVFTVAGSYVSSLVPSTTMENFSVFMTFLLGIKFIVKPVMTTKESMQGISAKKRAVQSVLCTFIKDFFPPPYSSVISRRKAGFLCQTDSYDKILTNIVCRLKTLETKKERI